MPNSEFDVIVLGGGHNGLTAANYLAKAGLRVCVLERRAIVGGAAVTEEFSPGYRNSLASYVVSLLKEEIIDDLELRSYGYETILLPNSFYPGLDGSHLLLTENENHNKEQIGKFSSADHDALKEFENIVDQVGGIISKYWMNPPPKLSGGGLSDVINAIKLGNDIYKLDSDARHRLIQFLVGAPETIIERWFESDKIKAVIAAHCMPGNYASLEQPGAGLAMLHHAVGEIDGKQGSWGLVKGGMGKITQAMAASAIAKGVEIRTDSEVDKILVQGNKVQGVRLKQGAVLSAKIVAANTDPKRTFLTLLGEKYLPDNFAKDISAYRMESASLRMNLALKGLPEFACIDGQGVGEHHRSTITFIENKQHLETVFRSARAGIPADRPIIEAIIPSVLDDTLTDKAGTHVMSLLCKYMPFDLADGRHWDTEKEPVVAKILDYLALYIPNLHDILDSWQCLTPLDIERIFGMTRGDILHGRLEPDQMLSMRPHPEAAQYATPVDGLYLCGSGAHPGGGVSGVPGRNAANRILNDLRN